MDSFVGRLPFAFVAPDWEGHVSNYLEYNSSSVIWSPIFVRDTFPQEGSMARFLASLTGLISEPLTLHC